MAATGGEKPILAWHDLSVRIPLKSRRATPDLEEGNVKTILSSVSGYIRRGELMYIMGPSGSGKSTLLDTLSDRLLAKPTGAQYLNDALKTPSSIRAASKYVGQTDDLPGVLTVEEHLNFAATLYNVPASERSATVNEVIKAVGLESARKTKVGNVFTSGLSGGQKRRLSIAAELVAKPKVLFLDEPTSGLDSATAFHVMKYLREIARDKNIAIVVSIHQPSQIVYDFADTLLLLSGGGKQAYFGAADEAANYFRSVQSTKKPTDMSEIEWIVELVNLDFTQPETVQRFISSWTESSNYEETEKLLLSMSGSESATEGKLYKPKDSPFFTQVQVLVRRGIINAVRNPAVVWLRLAMYVMLSLMIGLVWLRLPHKPGSIPELNSAIFYICAFMMFMSVSVLPAYIDERIILAKERSNNAYGSSAYILAHTIYEIPFLFVLSLVCSPIVYFMVGLTPSFSRFVVFTLNLFVSLFASESLMLLISAAVPILIVGIAAGAMIFGVFMVVMGIFVPITSMTWAIRWIYLVAMHYFSYSTFLVNQYRDVIYPADPSSIFPPFPNDVQGESIYRGYGLEERIWVNFVVLFVMILFYRIAAVLWIHKFVTGKK